MRVLRSLLLLLGFAVGVAGCAQQPTAYLAYPGTAAPGIDNFVYGMGGPYVPVTGNGYAPSPYGAASYAQPSYGVASYAQPTYGVASYAQPSYGAGSYASPPYGGSSYALSPYGGLYGYATAPGQGGYTLDAGDRLRVVVFGQDGLTNSYAVSAAGNIDMPLIGAVGARGLTTDQLAARIADKLRDGYIREPHVAVEVEAYRPFFILGEVTQPGQYPYVANMTAETAIAIAGGFTARASRKSVVLTRSYYGQQARVAVPLTFPLRPGDTVTVQERWF